VNADWRNRYEVAVEATRAGGQLALRHFGGNLAAEWKPSTDAWKTSDSSPVTVADRETESLLRHRLSAAFPQDGFLGEEYGNQPGTSGYRWIIDPIDGTRNYFRGIPIWGTLVGLEQRGKMIAGFIEIPALGESYRAIRGEGAFCNDRRIHVSQVAKLADTTMLYTALSWFLKPGRQEAFLELMQATQAQRGFGDVYGFMLVARGAADLMLEYGVHAWDVAAVLPIIEEAGGVYTNYDSGQDIHKPDVLVSNGHLHVDALRIIQAHELEG
jgi:histidinol-phosphatase